MPKTSYARTLHQIVIGTYRLCGDYYPNATFGRIWTYEEVVAEVNRAVLACIDQTGGLRGNAVIFVSDNSDIYDLPQDCIRPIRIGFSGLDGWVLLPSSLTSYVDLPGHAALQEGNPYLFYGEFLAPNQIGVIPKLKDASTGFTFTRDHDHGLLRQIRDADGNYIPFDANAPLRGIRGVPFQRTGDGRIIREVISPGGNTYIYVDYVRSPAKMIIQNDYPDPYLPEWIHKDIKYGAAQNLLRFRRNKFAQLQAKRFQKKWLKANLRLQALMEHQGPMNNEVRPM
jgi:hypothetical protein